MEIIKSKTNKRFSKYRSLQQNKYRQAYGLFQVEGYKMVLEALESDLIVEEIIVSESSAYRDEFENPMVLSDGLFADLSTMKNPEGVMGILHMGDKTGPSEASRILVLDGVSDPGNLGTLIRSADAFGFTRILTMEGTASPYNPKSLRATMGSIFRVAIEAGDENKILALKSQGYRVISSSLEDSVSLRDFRAPDKYILVIGSESHGISQFFKDEADIFIKIPMEGGAESLNAGVAGGILMYDLSK